MKTRVTTLALGCLLLGTASAVQAQPERTDDVRWARDVAGATLTLDGNLDEPVWQDAETIELKWNNENYHEPGGGWDDFFASFTITPTDPVDATVHLLRNGNVLWIGVEARDKSVGGAPDSNQFFRHDGLIMSILNKNRRPAEPYTSPNNFNGANTDEFFFTWLNRGATPGAEPALFGNLGDDRTVWDGRAVVDGTSNDDNNGGTTGADDVGYTMELWIDLSKLGIDMTDADGDRLPIGIAVYDLDYAWPADPAKQFLSRAWWQNPWGGDMPNGVGFIYGRPGVTVSSGDLPAAPAADLVLPSAGASNITLDGELNESMWAGVTPQVTLQYQMSPAELDALPGFGPYYTHWFRPGGDAEGAPPVVDPTEGRIRFFFQGNDLYAGLDADDQAISGSKSLDRADGFRVTLRTDSVAAAGGPRIFQAFTVLIDSMGNAVMQDQAATNPGVRARVHLKGASTVADASDVDEGYQIEMAIDLSTLPGFENGVPDGIIHLGAAFIDGDYTSPDDETQSYGTRTWFLTESGANSPFGGPAIRTFLDASLRVANEDDAAHAARLTLRGNQPNPFNARTRIAYDLPRAGRVTITVTDVLGRTVATLRPGPQAAGRNEVSFSGASLASGLYLYRVQVEGAEATSATGRMVIVK